MSAVASPYGLIPVKMVGGRVATHGINEYPMTVNSATGIFAGDLINLSGGSAAPITATPTTTLNANTPIGVCVGVRYVNPTTKQEWHDQQLPANAINNGYTNIFVKVVDDPDAVFQVQADGAVTAASVGKNAPLTGFSAGSTYSGKSGVKLQSAGIAATATLAVRIYGLPNSAGFSVPGDAFTDVWVMFNQGVHALRNATGQ